jgi:hypothetical protein
MYLQRIEEMCRSLPTNRIAANPAAHANRVAITGKIRAYDLGVFKPSATTLKSLGLKDRAKEKQRSGGADGIRTHDLLDAIEARSQLRHGPTFYDWEPIITYLLFTLAVARGGMPVTAATATCHRQKRARYEMCRQTRCVAASITPAN